LEKLLLKLGKSPQARLILLRMATTSTSPYFLADFYSFKWSQLAFRPPLISASAVAFCLFLGILAGHPGGGLIAGGGASTIGFGANQRITDSRLIPMIAAIVAASTAALVGTRWRPDCHHLPCRCLAAASTSHRTG
jgi:hypothetical protein